MKLGRRILVLSLLLTMLAAGADASTLRLPASLVTIAADAFNGDTALREVVLPDGIRTIQARAFANSSLTGINLPDSLTAIDDSAFSGVMNVRVTANMGTYAYRWAVGRGYIAEPTASPLADFVIEEGLVTEYIGQGGDVVIPKKDANGNSVTGIDECAFKGCDSLITVFIPDSVITIDDLAFYECSGLTSVSISNGVKTIDECAFGRCGNLTRVSIPNSVTYIGDAAFERCSSLTSIFIPDSVTRIDDYAFGSCDKLQTIIVDNNNGFYMAIDGVLFSKDGKALLQCPGGKTGRYRIPDSVTSIGNNAFKGCGNLTICGTAGSYAERYANGKGIPFVLL